MRFAHLIPNSMPNSPNRSQNVKPDSSYRQSIANLIRFCLILLIIIALGIGSGTPAQAQIRLRLWHSWRGAQAQLLEAWAEGFVKRTGTLQIEATYVPIYEMQARLASTPNSQRPDMLLAPADWAAVLFKGTLTAPLDLKLTPLIRAQVSDAVWPSAQYDGKTLGIPVTLEGLTLYYNQQLVGAQALPATWEDLVTQAQQSPARYGLTFGAGFYPTAGLFFASGNDLMRADGTDLLTNEQALSVYLVQMARLYQQVQASAGKLDYGGSGATFRYNEIAFWLNGTWDYADYRQVMGDRFGAMPIPPVGATPWQPMTRATLLYVTANSRQLDAAVSFGRFITQAEAQQQAAELASMIPIRSGITISDPILAPIAAQLIESGKPILPHPQLRLYWRVLREAIDAVTVDGRAPDTVALETLVTIQTALRPPPKGTPTPTATRRP